MFSLRGRTGGPGVDERTEGDPVESPLEFRVTGDTMRTGSVGGVREEENRNRVLHPGSRVRGLGPSDRGRV